MRAKTFQKLVSAILSLVLCLGLCSTALAAGDDTPTVTVETIITPQYEEASTFSDGCAAVKQGGKWGLIDESGKMVIQPKYDWVGMYNEGVAVAAIRSEDELMDWEAERYDLYLVYGDGSEKRLRDFYYGPEGPEDLEASEDGWYPTKPAYLSIEEDSGFTIEDYGTYWFCTEGVVNVNGLPYTVEGEIIYPKNFQQATGNEYYDTFTMLDSCNDGVIPMFAASAYIGDYNYGNCFFMDKNGNITRVFEDNYIRSVYAPDSGRIVYCYLFEQWENEEEPLANYWGAMDTNGNRVIQPVYSSFRYDLGGIFFFDGVWTVIDQDGKYGGIDENGAVVIPFELDFMGSFKQGLCPAIQDGEAFYIDLNNRTYQVESPNGGTAVLTVAGGFNTNGVAAVYDSVSQKAYCVQNTPDENRVLPMIEGSENLALKAYFPDYDGSGELGLIRSIPNNGIITIEENGKWGFARLTFHLTEGDVELPTVPVVSQYPDVKATDYYHQAVVWAVENGITNGTSETAFSPDNTCDRGQVVTFLHRTVGTPAVSGSSSFSDVSAGSYYADAVNWAVTYGITQGTSATTFSPSAACDRGQVVTFLWRSAGSPEPVTASNPFSDVSPSDYFYKAVLWAVENGITTGTSPTTFSPSQLCNRGQVVTFLYRSQEELNSANLQPVETTPAVPDTPQTGWVLPNNKPATDANIQEILYGLKAQYPEGMSWTNVNTYYSPALYTIGGGCEAFALICSDAVFADLPVRRNHSDFDAIRVGDLIRMNHNTHTVIVLEKRADSIIVAEGNYNSSIHWGREISRQELVNGAFTVRTRYPA